MVAIRQLSREEETQAAETLARWEEDVRILAFRMQGNCAEVEDLQQVGRLAVLRWAPEFRIGGMSERAYIWMKVRRAMSNYIRANHSLVRVPADKFRQLRMPVYSLQVKLPGQDREWLEMLAAEPSEAAACEGELRLLKRALRSLSPREVEVIERRFFKGEILKAIATDMQVHPERVRQIQNEALERLRKRLRELV